MKAYKLFRIKDGKLYPLYVNANEETPLGVWLEAQEGERTEDGKVKSKLGKLAYRPGWHCADHPIAIHIGEKENKTDKLPSYRAKDQVWAEVEVFDVINYQPLADSMGKCARDKCLRHIPALGYYKYKTNANMFETWIIAGHIKVNRILTDAEVSAINAEIGRDDLPRRKEA